MIARPAPLAAAVLACAAPHGGAEPQPDAGMPQVIVRSSAGDVAVTVEVARTDEERARGLMFRKSIAEGEGMLFVFPEEGAHPFWMKDTLVSLDMIFIDGLGTITGIEARAPPLSAAPRLAGPSRYVLEVAGGWAERHGVKPGDKVRFRGALRR